MGQHVELTGGEVHLRQIRHATVANTAHKTGIAQAQNRHQPDQVLCQAIGFRQRQRLALGIQKTAAGGDMTLMGLLCFETIENPPIAIRSLSHAVRQRAIATGAIVTRFGFTKGQNDMQVALATLHITGWKPEVIAGKRIQFCFR